MKGFFYGSSIQNAVIRIVRGALVAAGPTILLAMPAGICAVEANRVVFDHLRALNLGADLTRRDPDNGTAALWLSRFFHSQAVSAKNGVVHG